MSELVIYPARRVRTMDPARPVAQAVAVAGDRVRAVGTMDELAAYGHARIDDRYADSVLFPGFVEAHSHVASGGMWSFTYVGYFDRTSPDGRRWPGCRSVSAVLERLRQVGGAPDDEQQPILAWGLDPIYFRDDERMGARELDTVSATRPILIQHASGHLATVNTALLVANGITRDTRTEGVVKDGRGEPTGELRGIGAQRLVHSIGSPFRLGAAEESTLRSFAADACNHGVTSVVDLGNQSLMDDGAVARYRSVVDDPDFPARLSIFHLGTVGDSDAESVAAVERVRELRRISSAKLRFGHVKIILDGSIQGYTARLRPPGYLADDRQGIWVMDPDDFATVFRTFHRAGLMVHVHCNGDEATEVFLDTVEAALQECPRWDHRHTVEHCQLSTPAQYRRMAALGVGANLFVNHIWYWGDQHRDVILGPDRASRMDGTATALRSGVPIALHSDTPVTPMDPLATVRIAATRRTPSGNVLGPDEAISVPAALHAVTLGAAYLLKMDHEIGSIEGGKFADFAVLSSDPFDASPEDVGDVEVRATVVGGRHFASRASNRTTSCGDEGRGTAPPTR